MANLKEVRARLKSVANTQQITKAMKMVSAAKLRRAQDAITRLRPYARKQNEMLRNILSNLDGEAGTSYGVTRPVNRACVVVITSNRGLAGAFNSNVIKAAVATINARFGDLARDGRLDILPIGKKGYDYFKKRYPAKNILADYVEIFSDLSFDNVAHVSRHLMNAFDNGTYDAVTVAYGQFRNAAVQEAQSVQWLPVEQMEAVEEATDGPRFSADYIFEPNQQELLDYLVPSILQTTFQSYLLDTHASEHGARMTAMDKATENAQELMNDLRVFYNKARQEAITSELSEIVGGAAALEG